MKSLSDGRDKLNKQVGLINKRIENNIDKNINTLNKNVIKLNEKINKFRDSKVCDICKHRYPDDYIRFHEDKCGIKVDRKYILGEEDIQKRI